MQIFCVILSNDNFCSVKYYKVLLENRIMGILQMLSATYSQLLFSLLNSNQQENLILKNG
jgi:hypothetical protein